MEEAKRRTCYKRLIYKQFVQVSGLCDRQFLSYLPKCFSHLCRAFYGDVILVNTVLAHQYGRRQQKHLALTFSIKAFSSHSRTGIRAHKHIFQYLKWLYCWKSRGETFFQRNNIPILVSHTVKTRKFKLLYFRNELCFWNGNFYKDLLFVYLQPSVHKNS